MHTIITWIKFWVIGINKCKTCKGSGDGAPFGDSELLGISAYFPCETCHGTGTADGTTRIPVTTHKQKTTV